MSLHPAQELLPFFGAAAWACQQIGGDLRRRSIFDVGLADRALEHHAIEWLK
jgi:hypothetical protein